MEIREARASDVPSLEIVRRQAIESGFSGEYDRSAFAGLVAAPERKLPEWIEEPRYLTLIAETEISPLAFGTYDRDRATILALYTAPEEERRGLASALLERFEREARERGETELVAISPRGAVGYFFARGFERVGTAEWNGVSAYELTKSLGD